MLGNLRDQLAERQSGDGSGNRTEARANSRRSLQFQIPQIGLLNIVAGREVAREFVQDAFVPGDVADALEPLFEEGSPARNAMNAGLAEVRAKLGAPGASARVAEMAAGMLK